MQDTEQRFQLPQLTRAIQQVEEVTIFAEERTIEFPFSSEEPVERYFGDEVLSHQQGAGDFGRLNNAAPLLFNHDMDEIRGVVERAWIQDGRGWCRVRFAKTEDAEECLGMVQDGILRNVSFGYRIMEMVESIANGKSTYTATKWEPYEISLVTVPADPTVGIGRAEADDKRDVIVHRISEESAQPAEVTIEEPTMTEQTTQTVDVQVVASQAAEAERARIANITALGERFNATELSRKLINEGKSMDEARAIFLEEIKVDQKPVQSADIGLTQKEVRQFSFLRAINALSNPADRSAYEAAAFEREVSEAASKAAGKAARGMFIPGEILRAKRDLTVGTSTAGGNLVATELMADSFIELLRNRSVVQRAGATVMNGLNGNVAIPKQTGGATAYWVAESGAPTESQQTVGQVTMTPKTVGAFTDFSRKLMLQSSIDIENMVRRDLAAVIALAIDSAALYGTGSSNQPTGIKATSGINTKDFAADAPTFAEIVSLESEVAADNADIGTLCYVFNAAMRGGLKTTEKASSTGQFIFENGGTVNGYRSETSNQVAAGDVFFGNWADLLIGFWSGLDLTVDPYTSSTSGTVRVVALQDVDIAVRNAVSFCRGNNTL